MAATRPADANVLRKRGAADREQQQQPPAKVQHLHTPQPPLFHHHHPVPEAFDPERYLPADPAAPHDWRTHDALAGWSRLALGPPHGAVLFDAGAGQFYLEDGRPAYYDWTSGSVGPLFELWPAEVGGTPTALARLLLSVSPASSTGADRGTHPHLRAAHVSMQGRRPTQEDRHTLMEPLAGVPCTAALFGVYDGHLGTEAANFVASELPGRLSAALGPAVSALLLAHQEPELEQPLQEPQLLTDHRDAVSGIAECSQNYGEARRTEERHSDNALANTLLPGLSNLWTSVLAELDAAYLRQSRKGQRSGCCLLSVLRLGRLIVTANLGDSRAILCRDRGEPVQLTVDHKPEEPLERERIVAAGGHVMQVGPVYRVSRVSPEELKSRERKPAHTRGPPPLQLAVARSIGDPELKSPPALLSCTPDLSVRVLEPGDICIVLACDGVWDALSNADVAALVADGVASDDGGTTAALDAKAAANRITSEAFQRGSTDNITAVVIAVDWDEQDAG